ncbi:metal ABC transporter substrate-binding protein [Sulfurimonas microaerophilic]|uniref:metal ABC transporter substrate-binding protein n=1 Tax=Sulfurimonas microaerophilic TaxID=3058392 RepID=UPI002714DA82|nr:metal ABC transporter substrate-binding protein [Sulfurimonas sp. hsl 1-7]
MKNLKIVLALLSLVVVVLILTTGSNEQKLSSKPLVTTSNFAIYDLTKHIGGDKIELVNILPFGVDPHSFEPTPKIVAKLEKSKLFFYSGDVLEPWAQHLASEVHKLNMSKYVTLKTLEEEDEDHDDEDEEHEAHHQHHGAYDPHYWLDIDNMKQLSFVVTEQLSKVDPKNKHYFEKNKEQYIKQLDQLDGAYKQQLLECKLDTIIVTHNAFSYLADRYGFKVESLTGLSTEAQPSAEDVKHLLQEIKEKNIQVVFFENFANNKNIQTIADDMGVRVDSLQPLGNITGEEMTLKLDYIDIMKINLDKIAEAMQCR